MKEDEPQIPRTDEGICSNAQADRPPTMPSRGLLVRRERLLRELEVHGPKAGITLVCAPEGMGKTALLMQYVSDVAYDPARGSARLLDVSGMDAEEVYKTLRRLPETLCMEMKPLVAIDNMPELGSEALKIVPPLLRDLHAKGIEFICSCRPAARSFVHAMGDSYKIGAQALLVRPREYADWTQAFAIDRNLDVYELTQGIPSLVTALRAVEGDAPNMAHLVQEAVRLYSRVLEDLRHGNEALYRLVCLLLMVGEGRLSDLAYAGLRIRNDTVARLARDYPMFGIDVERTRFKCMALGSHELDALRSDVARRRSGFADKALQVLMSTGKVDEAVKLAVMVGSASTSQELICAWPLRLVLGGNGSFVMGTLAKLDGESAACIPEGMVLSVYAAALVGGEYRMARAMAAELHRRAYEVKREVSADVLASAYALADVWRDCPGVSLPELALISAEKGNAEAEKLVRHRRAWDDLIGGSGYTGDAAMADVPDCFKVLETDIPDVLLMCDGLLNTALHGDLGDVIAWDKHLQGLAQRLRDRRAAPVAEMVRMTAATCRLMAGVSIIDERAFVDAGTIAVRTSDFSMQLFCLLGEGWQALDEGQVVNARFRAQQVLRLAQDDQVFLRSWAQMLERSAYIVNTAKFALSEEADLVDLSREQVDAAEAWSVALLLSASGHASELSAWYSVHKATMLEAQFRPMAHQAMRAVGDCADALRCMLPASFDAFGGGRMGAAPHPEIALYGTDVGAYDYRSGQIEVNLFGGFRIKRNGHVLTDLLWRRKRLCVLTARLVLAHGAFVDRHIITEEMWPASEYAKARENLYTALSALRSAFGQQGTGPQYLLTQGEGLAINTEYVMSDVAHFDILARDVLLKRTGTSGRQIIESCLKLEELYAGPLYVSDLGDTSFHLRMRKLYLAKFVDCMLRGVEAALVLEDLPTASWLIEAAQRQAPYREDVMRQAMRIYDRCGRRREIVEMYNAHLHYLKQVANTVPEDETRLAYESIMGKGNLEMVM